MLHTLDTIRKEKREYEFKDMLLDEKPLSNGRTIANYIRHNKDGYWYAVVTINKDRETARGCFQVWDKHMPDMMRILANYFNEVLAFREAFESESYDEDSEARVKLLKATQG